MVAMKKCSVGYFLSVYKLQVRILNLLSRNVQLKFKLGYIKSQPKDSYKNQ